MISADERPGAYLFPNLLPDDAGHLHFQQGLPVSTWLEDNCIVEQRHIRAIWLMSGALSEGSPYFPALPGGRDENAPPEPRGQAGLWYGAQTSQSVNYKRREDRRTSSPSNSTTGFLTLILLSDAMVRV